MERRHHGNSVVVVPLAPQARDRHGRPQDGLGRELAKRNHHFRLDRFHLPPKEGRATRDFIFLRIAIAGRAAFHHVANIHILAAHLHALFDDISQQLARLPDKWLSCLVLVLARALPDKQDSREGIPTPKAVPFRIRQTKSETKMRIMKVPLN